MVVGPSGLLACETQRVSICICRYCIKCIVSSASQIHSSLYLRLKRKGTRGTQPEPCQTTTLDQPTGSTRNHTTHIHTHARLRKDTPLRVISTTFPSRHPPTLPVSTTPHPHVSCRPPLPRRALHTMPRCWPHASAPMYACAVPGGAKGWWWRSGRCSQARPYACPSPCDRQR